MSVLRHLEFNFIPNGRQLYSARWVIRGLCCSQRKSLHVNYKSTSLSSISYQKITHILILLTEHATMERSQLNRLRCQPMILELKRKAYEFPSGAYSVCILVATTVRDVITGQ